MCDAKHLMTNSHVALYQAGMPLDPSSIDRTLAAHSALTGIMYVNQMALVHDNLGVLASRDDATT
jgi:hypothetical protein